MFKEKKTILKIYKDGRKYSKIIGIYICDNFKCLKEFEKKYWNGIENKDHYCSRKCVYEAKKPGGKINLKFKNTNNKKFGVDYPAQNKEIRQKQKETCLEKYDSESPLGSVEIQQKAQTTIQERFGVSNILLLPEIQTKRKETCLERFGVKNPILNPEIREKRDNTNLEKYGHISPFGNKEIQEIIKKHNQEKFGVDYPLQNEKIFNQTRETLKRNFGVETPLENRELVIRQQNTMMDRYGVKVASQSKEIMKDVDWIKAWEKAHQTKKINQSYAKSIPEDKFYNFLCSVFKKNNIRRYIKIFNKNIDFYIKYDKKFYIEFDGIFWHGLDKPIEEIEFLAKKSEIHKHRCNRFFDDRRIDKIFKEKGLKLIRITDKEFNKCEKDNNYELIMEKIFGELI